MNVELNGDPVTLPDGASVGEAIEVSGAAAQQRGVAVAVDGEVVPRSEWDRTGLREGQKVEVLAAIQGGAEDGFELGGRSWGSRLIVGTGGFRSLDQMEQALIASGTEIVTVALRRVDPEAEGSVLDVIRRLRLFALPNTAGCFTARDAVRTAKLAREAGADEVILYTEQDFVEETNRITGGEGVHVVYDSVGKDTFDSSLDVLRPRGYMVLCGASSGPVPPFDPQTLNQKGGLFLTRPALAQYTATREELLWRAESLFSWIGQNNLDVRIGGTYSLEDAEQAHRDLEGRKTTGKLLLIP